MRFFKETKESKRKKAEKILSRHFEELGRDITVEPMAGGASDRDYFRVLMPQVPVNNTGVLMLLNKSFRLEKLDYYQVSEVLRKLHLPKPQIYQEFSRDGALLLQDVGQVHLQDLVTAAPEDEKMVQGLYQQAIDHLIVLQTRADNYAEGVRAFQRAFDAKKLRKEMKHAHRHFIRKFTGYKLSGAEKKVYWKFIDELCEQIAALPRVFCHRDYHSANLLLWLEQLYMVDFQDARMGPCLYDVVSLLGDSYVEISNELRYKLLQYFADQHPDYDPDDMKQVYEEYTLIALQRHLKHLGTFAALHNRGYDESLEYMPRTMGYLRENLVKFEELQEPAEVLNRIFDAATLRLKQLERE